MLVQYFVYVKVRGQRERVIQWPILMYVIKERVYVVMCVYVCVSAFRLKSNWI